MIELFHYQGPCNEAFFTTSWLPVREYRKLLINIGSSEVVPPCIFIEFSREPVQGGIKPLSYSFQGVGQGFKSDFLSVRGEYIRLSITFPGPESSLHLEVDIYGVTPGMPKLDGPCPSKEKKSFFGKPVGQVSQVPNNTRNDFPTDYRLPGYIPQNTLLIGGPSGKLMSMSPDVEGSVLMIKNGKPTWCSFKF